EHIERRSRLADVYAQYSTIHVGNIGFVIAAVISVEREAPQAHGRVWHRRNADGLQEVSVLVQDKKPLASRIGLGSEEVAATGIHVDLVVVDGDAERMPWEGKFGEHAGVADLVVLSVSLSEHSAEPEDE